MFEIPPNVLAWRYTSTRLRQLWSPRTKVVMERQLWVAVLRAQRSLGTAVEQSVIDDYVAVIDEVDLGSIAEREAVTRHDVKARIEEFCALAGHQQIHRAMTSRDLTENVEQMQILASLKLIREGLVSLIVKLAQLAETHADLAMSARTHNVAAQPTTLGKRFADWATEAMLGYDRLTDLIERYPLRGIKGAVGTQVDLVDLLGSEEAVAELERLVAQHCGFSTTLASTGQVYPRSLDLDVVAALTQAVCAASSMALTLRLMAGHGLVSEGFREGQVGSSAMPHKINARSSERIGALRAVLDGHLTMAASLAGRQWNEGDVSCSAARRVVLPDAFYAADGLLHTARAVLDELQVFDKAISAELRRDLPLLGTSRILSALTEAGMGREQAHELVAENVAAWMHAGGTPDGKKRQEGVLERIRRDPRVLAAGIDLPADLESSSGLAGTANRQVAEVVARAHAIAQAHPTHAAERAELRV